MAVRSAQTSRTRTKWTPSIFFSTAGDNKWRGRLGQRSQDRGGQEACRRLCLNRRSRFETEIVCSSTRIPGLYACGDKPQVALVSFK
jgi:hypothetical protein